VFKRSVRLKSPPLTRLDATLRPVVTKLCPTLRAELLGVGNDRSNLEVPDAIPRAPDETDLSEIDDDIPISTDIFLRI
jgi:hypothetical protein